MGLILKIVLDSQIKFDKHKKKLSKMVRINLNSFKIIRQYLIRAFVLFVITVWTQTSESLFKKKNLKCCIIGH